ncbi:MAG: DUF3592 domain-containing protein [Verrucomicrobiota bacterium]|jgi:hypothetical protein
MTSENKGALESFIGVATVCFIIGLWIRHKERVSRNWPQSAGKIIVSRTERQPTGRPGQAQFVPVIEYQFTYRGQTFTSSHWRAGNYSLGDADSATAVVSRYPFESPVVVFVNPKNPAKSVLERSTTPLSWIPIGFGIGFLLLSLIPILSSVVSRK